MVRTMKLAAVLITAAMGVMAVCIGRPPENHAAMLRERT